MCKASTYLVVMYIPTYLPINVRDLFPTKLVTKVKPNTNSVQVHPQLSNNSHPVDGALVGASSLWPTHTHSLLYSLCYISLSFSSIHALVVVCVGWAVQGHSSTAATTMLNTPFMLVLCPGVLSTMK
jgi:hypothetical protein